MDGHGAEQPARPRRILDLHRKRLLARPGLERPEPPHAALVIEARREAARVMLLIVPLLAVSASSGAQSAPREAKKLWETGGFKNPESALFDGLKVVPESKVRELVEEHSVTTTF